MESHSIYTLTRIPKQPCEHSPKKNVANLPQTLRHSHKPRGSPPGTTDRANFCFGQNAAKALVGILWVSRNWGHLLGGPCSKDDSILGSILGSPYFGKLPIRWRSGEFELLRIMDSVNIYVPTNPSVYLVELFVYLSSSVCPGIRCWGYTGASWL